jgi:hypothetical protein
MNRRFDLVVVFVLAIVAFAVVTIARFFGDFDLFWHFATGRVIV